MTRCVQNHDYLYSILVRKHSHRQIVEHRELSVIRLEAHGRASDPDRQYLMLAFNKLCKEFVVHR